MPADEKSRPAGEGRAARVSTLTDKTPPRIQPVDVVDWLEHRNPLRRYRLVIVRCVFCQQLHRHGWPAERTDPGMRISHCVDLDKSGTYYIEAPPS
ncbi:hypothetical protein [Nocardioides sp. URHA0020]|uniref:hypothetical protein n=1 Tax=Nocardioides sp. URHA0020 TaxID=1380392 RepID=UPI00048A675F|nr:hypothetical protein [Nocardioides sp. URHA0020]